MADDGRGVDGAADRVYQLLFLVYLNADSSEVSIVHVFPDADAMDRHMEGVAERAKQSYACMEPAGFEIHGTPNAGVLEMMKRMTGSNIPLSVRSQYVSGFMRLRPQPAAS